MKVLLICPVPPRQHWPRGMFRNTHVPTGVAHIAAALKASGDDVRVYSREEHLSKRSMDWDEADAHLRQTLREFAPDVLGLSVTTPMLDEAKTLSETAREILGPHVLIAMGGPHVTAMPAQALSYCPAVDVAVIGEGEQTMVDLLDRGPQPDVAGLAWLCDGQLRRNEPRTPPHDLDALEPIDYGMFDMDWYTTPSRWLIRWMDMPVTNLRTSRGCTNRCAFCGGHLVNGFGVRMHSVEYVVERMRLVVEKFGVRGIHFEDDTLGADPDRLMRLCDAIRSAGLDRKIIWDGCLRVDQAEPKLLVAMKAAGCVQIEYGFECGSDEMLRKLGKAATLEQNRLAVTLTHEAGLRVFADIMIGLPGETRDNVAATERFLRWARPDVVTPSVLCPLPGTAIFNALDEQTRENLDWGAYAYMDTRKLGINITAMDDEEFRDVCRAFIRGFVHPWLLRQILRDTAPDNHADRQMLKAALRRYMLRHPIRYARMPMR